MGWEEYVPRHRSEAHEDATITAHGDITWCAADHVVMGTPGVVTPMYDRLLNVIALKPTEDRRKGYTVGTRTNRFGIRAVAFLDHHGIRPEKALRIPTHWDGEKPLICNEEKARTVMERDQT